MTYNELVNAAMKARKNSYSPYSRFRVGAALLTKEGKLYTGANIENSSYGLTVCAERTAIFKAVSEGEHNFTALAVACDTDQFNLAYPCGACRQVMTEFLKADADIIVSINTGKYKIHKLNELLPNSFKL